MPICAARKSLDLLGKADVLGNRPARMRAKLPPVTIANWAVTCGHTMNLVRFEQGSQQKKRVGKTELIGSKSIARSFYQQEVMAAVNHPECVPIPVVV